MVRVSVIEETLMILPPPSSLATTRSVKRLLISQALFRLVSITESQSSSSIIMYVLAPASMPALLISTCTGPSAASAASKNSVMLSLSVTSSLAPKA